MINWQILIWSLSFTIRSNSKWIIFSSAANESICSFIHLCIIQPLQWVFSSKKPGTWHESFVIVFCSIVREAHHGLSHALIVDYVLTNFIFSIYIVHERLNIPSKKFDLCSVMIKNLLTWTSSTFLPSCTTGSFECTENVFLFISRVFRTCSSVFPFRNIWATKLLNMFCVTIYNVRVIQILIGLTKMAFILNQESFWRSSRTLPKCPEQRGFISVHLNACQLSCGAYVVFLALLKRKVTTIWIFSV